MQFKSKTAGLKSRSEMETLVREIATLKLGERRLAANMDAEIQMIRETYEPRLAEFARELEEKTNIARIWAETNTPEFDGRRSIDFGHGIAGFRVGPPKLKTIMNWKWDGVLDSLRAWRGGAAYIRVKEEINKERIIDEVSAGILKEKDLRNVGARVVQEELFFVEPKLTRTDFRAAKAA